MDSAKQTTGKTGDLGCLPDCDGRDLGLDHASPAAIAGTQTHSFR